MAEWMDGDVAVGSWRCDDVDFVRDCGHVLLVYYYILLRVLRVPQHLGHEHRADPAQDPEPERPYSR